MNIPRGRYAPTPSGWLHLGNARTALAAWLSVRSQGGAFVWRLEDLDGPRTVPGMAEAAEEDLRWLGLDWDEGPEPVGGPFAPYVQSQRAEIYEAALEHLAQAGRLFPCRVSRADLANLATAPHGREGTPPYPASLRPKSLETGWFEALRANPKPDAALRFHVDSEPVSFVDRIRGPITEQVDETVGDFVLKRRDGVYAYQLAVVVDDLAMGITEVVRGRDLLDSTARQIQLIQALGGQVPAYAHLPLVVNAEGEKLSKRDDASRLRALRESGVAPEEVIGQLGASLGLLDRPEPCRAEELVPLFGWEKVPREAGPTIRTRSGELRIVE
ncbi:MAG TPA: tRNA glutamyl-Q(34) synthetase GluQRS [Thermoanaerobaculia bacterium]|nr:tRNA glutamyl-Q(34) synthetase GluQRS [Thermoanaerobaculia bacterium]